MINLPKDAPKLEEILVDTAKMPWREKSLKGVSEKMLWRNEESGASIAMIRFAKGAGIRVLRTAVQAPPMNSVANDFSGAFAASGLDHLIIMSEPHLLHVLTEYALNYFNTARPHQGIGQRIPVPAERVRAQFAGSVTAIPVLGGLHHEYRAAA